MAFRDESDALRAKIEVLESELREALRRVEELQAAGRERDALKARVRELEAALGAARPTPPTTQPKLTRPSAARWIPIAAAVVALATTAIIALSDGSLFGPDVNAAPTDGMVDLAAHPMPPPLQSHTSGDHDASARFEHDCNGYVPDRPHLVLRTHGAQTAVRLATSANEDTVLVLRTADGAIHCDDDSGEGRNALLNVQLPPGDHRVWVGTYSEGQSTDFTLATAATTDADEPIAGEQPTVVQVSDEPFVATIEGTAMATILGNQSESECHGYIPASPQVQLALAVPSFVSLRTTSTTDLVLRVRGSDGTVRCDDDSGGSLQPSIGDRFPAGPLDVWVGTYQAGARASFELEVSSSPSTEVVSPEPPTMDEPAEELPIEPPAP